MKNQLIEAITNTDKRLEEIKNRLDIQIEYLKNIHSITGQNGLLSKIGEMMGLNGTSQDALLSDLFIDNNCKRFILRYSDKYAEKLIKIKIKEATSNIDTLKSKIKEICNKMIIVITDEDLIIERELLIIIKEFYNTEELKSQFIAEIENLLK